MKIEKYQNDITDLTNQIKTLIDNSKKRITQNVNQEIITTYWKIGKIINEREVTQNIDIETISNILLDLSKTLTKQAGKGFSRSNLTYMRLLYLVYPNGIDVKSPLSWSHYIEFLKIDDTLERSFYEQQSILEKWSVRELRRQKDSALFQRLALSKDKKGILDLAQKGQQLNKEEESIEGDNPPIGIILAAGKDEIMVRYATGGLSNKVFVSKYQTYLPDKDLLQEQIRKILDDK